MEKDGMGVATAPTLATFLVAVLPVLRRGSVGDPPNPTRTNSATFGRGPSLLGRWLDYK